MRITFIFKITLLAGAASVLAACSNSSSPSSAPPEGAPDPPEVALGERLFLETRFAQFFAVHAGDDVNQPLSSGDPTVDQTVTTGDPLAGPFAGASINCRACHLVDEQTSVAGGGSRTYGDFARRSPIPAREDGAPTTPRNSPALVDASRPRGVATVFHLDGEFATLEDLTRATYTGRNFGWLADEQGAAVENLARVIRGDDGSGDLAGDFGGLSYATVLAGTDASIPDDLRIPSAFRVDVTLASDGAILDAVAKLVAAYVRQLEFQRDDAGEHDGSPYDRFLEKNGLPRGPGQGESPLDYSRRLRSLLAKLDAPKFVADGDGSFELHAQPFAFGPDELRGLEIFLAEPDATAPATAGLGNCVACHQAPDFTDFRLHNTGVAQDEYDAVHGDGAFAALAIPDLAQRNAAPDAYLPPSPAHPRASGVFRKPPSKRRPGEVDLGAWNIVGNPAVPTPQAALASLLCDANSLEGSDCNAANLLPRAIALFKTPTLRDLGDSQPYLHTGGKDSIAAVLQFYLTTAGRARAGRLRNGAPELRDMALSQDDLVPLERFLVALDEDYS
jgi:cytochrome c peroxidase